MNRQYNSKIDYIGKWVLYKEYGSAKNYYSIFVISIKDGILKYYDENDTNTPKYTDIEDFKYYNTFIINPIQMPSPYIDKIPLDELDVNSEVYTTRSYSGTVDGGMKLKRCSYGHCSNGRCDGHRNGYCTKSVLCSYPPQYQRCDFESDVELYKECSKV